MKITKKLYLLSNYMFIGLALLATQSLVFCHENQSVEISLEEKPSDKVTPNQSLVPREVSAVAQEGGLDSKPSVGQSVISPEGLVISQEEGSKIKPAVYAEADNSLLQNKAGLTAPVKHSLKKGTVAQTIQQRFEFVGKPEDNLKVLVHCVFNSLKVTLLESKDHRDIAETFLNDVQQCCSWSGFRDRIEYRAKIFDPLWKSLEVLEDSKKSSSEKRTLVKGLFENIARYLTRERQRLNSVLSPHPNLEFPAAETITMDWNSFGTILESPPLLERFTSFVWNHVYKLSFGAAAFVFVLFGINHLRQNTEEKLGRHAESLDNKLSDMALHISGPPSDEFLNLSLELLEETLKSGKNKYYDKLLGRFEKKFQPSIEPAYEPILSAIEKARKDLDKLHFFKTPRDHLKNFESIKNAIDRARPELRRLYESSLMVELKKTVVDLRKATVGTQVTQRILKSLVMGLQINDNRLSKDRFLSRLNNLEKVFQDIEFANIDPEEPVELKKLIQGLDAVISCAQAPDARNFPSNTLTDAVNRFILDFDTMSGALEGLSLGGVYIGGTAGDLGGALTSITSAVNKLDDCVRDVRMDTLPALNSFASNADDFIKKARDQTLPAVNTVATNIGQGVESVAGDFGRITGAIVGQQLTLEVLRQLIFKIQEQPAKDLRFQHLALLIDLFEQIKDKNTSQVQAIDRIIVVIKDVKNKLGELPASSWQQACELVIPRSKGSSYDDYNLIHASIQKELNSGFSSLNLSGIFVPGLIEDLRKMSVAFRTMPLVGRS